MGSNSVIMDAQRRSLLATVGLFVIGGYVIGFAVAIWVLQPERPWLLLFSAGVAVICLAAARMWLALSRAEGTEAATTPR
jgi:hypothetical protein